MKPANRTTRDLRRINRGQALRTLYFDGPVSRLQVSRMTELSPATVSNVVAELLSEGIIIESGSVDSEVGRPSTLLSINRHYGCFFGIEVGEALIRIEVFDLILSPLDSLSIPLSLIENPPEQVEAIAGGINKLLAQLGFGRKQVIGVGIGMPGIVDSASGVSVYAAHWNWRDVPFHGLLEDELDFPFFLENGTNAMAFAEHLFGSGEKAGSMLVLSLGNGVGAGIISEGKLFRGVSNSAGEWGHTTVDIDGPACRCGSRGCLEAYIGSAGVIRRFLGDEEGRDAQGHEDQQELIQSILDASREGDPRARAVVQDTLQYLGVGIANLVNLLNPAKVVIGGWLGLLLGEQALAELRAVLARFGLAQPRAAASIELSNLGLKAETLGAAALVMSHFLENAGPDAKLTRHKKASGSRRPPVRLVRVLAVSGLETNVLLRHLSELQSQTGITPSIEQVTRSQWGERKNRELVENSGFYDVIMVAGGDDLLWVKLKGHVQPLNGYLQDSDLRQLMHREYFEDDGMLFGMPQYYNFPMLYYRKDLLSDPAEQKAFMRRHGRPLAPPRDFDELERVAEFFHRPPDLYGFFVGGVEWSVFLDYTYFAFGNQTYLGDPDTGKLALDTAAAKRAMGALCRMVRFNPPGWQTLSFFDAERLFKSGKVFMYQNWMYATKVLMAAMPGKVGIAPVVGDKQPGEHLGSFLAVIPRDAPNPDAAGKFISWMLSPGYQKAQSMETGNLPVRKDVLEDPEVQAALVGFDQYQKALPYLSYQRTTWFGELSAGISEAIWKILGGQMTPDQAMDWLQNTKYKDRKAIE